MFVFSIKYNGGRGGGKYIGKTNRIMFLIEGEWGVPIKKIHFMCFFYVY